MPDYVVDRKIPARLEGASDPARYKALWGGRGGGKSHFFAEEIVERIILPGVTTRVACIREHQNSLRESSRQIILDKISANGLDALFDITESEIRVRHNGSLVIFRGMKAWNAETIKSIEGYDIAWVEEAQNLSSRSLKILRPTLRKPGSEIWFSWNPRYEGDPVDQFFRGENPPRDAYIQSIHWMDNPWLPEELYDEMQHDYATDPELAENVWAGGYEVISEGSYYSRMLRKIEEAGRIGDFPYDPTLPVHTAWDIGVDDYSAIWFLQEDGEWVTVLDYYETSGDGAQQIIDDALPEYSASVEDAARTLHRLDRPPYRYGSHFFPHDVRVREWGQGARSRVETLQNLGLKNIHKGANVGPDGRIHAVREMLPITRFNNTKRVQRGLSRLRRYSRRYNDKLDIWMGPLHDDNSHGADAFGEYAVNCPLVGRPPEKQKPIPQPPGSVVLEGPPKPRTGSRIRI